MEYLVPDWASFDADKTVGLDLLGLRAPVQCIGNDWFDGVTTVTPKIRYRSVLTWIARRYASRGIVWVPAPSDNFVSLLMGLLY